MRVVEDRPDRLKPFEVSRALKDHHAFFTTAPFVRLTVGAASLGDVPPEARLDRPDKRWKFEEGEWKLRHTVWHHTPVGKGYIK